MEPAFILVLIVSIAISMVLSGMEAGVFALNRLRIRRLMRAGNPRAGLLYSYLERPEDFLWTILVGNTTANVVIFSLIVLGLHHWLQVWPGFLLLALVLAVITFYAVCELLPKILFRLYPNRLCMFMAVPFRVLHLLFRPLVAPVALFAGTFLRWSGGKRFTGHLFGNRDELRLLMQESGQVFSTEERAMINRVLDLQNYKVRHVTTPIAKAVSVEVGTSVRDVLEVCRQSGLTRLPVWSHEHGRHRVVGLVSLRSLIYRDNLELGRTAVDYLKPALYLDQDMRLEIALRQMQKTGQRLAIVLNRDSHEVGFVSLQDILKVIFGEVSL